MTAHDTAQGLSEPDTDAIKAFNKKFVTGVTIVTTTDDSGPRGLAVNAYSSISLEPPLVMVCIQSTSSTYAALHASTHLGINIVSTEQRDVLGVFSSKETDKFASLNWHQGPHGSPLIDASAAKLEGEIRERFQTRTHTVFICRVRYCEEGTGAPVVYSAGRFYAPDHLRELD